MDSFPLHDDRAPIRSSIYSRSNADAPIPVVPVSITAVHGVSRVQKPKLAWSTKMSDRRISHFFGEGRGNHEMRAPFRI